MKILATFLSALLIGLADPAWADIDRDEAATVAQRATNGRVLSVDRTQAGGRSAWRVKVVTSKGDVVVVMIDAATGQLI